MSFASEVIDELMGIELPKTCCRKAMLFGLFLGAAFVDDRTLRAEFRNQDIAERACEILSRQFSTQAKIDSFTHAGRRMYSVEARTKAVASFLRSIEDEGEQGPLSTLVGFRCQSCAHSFLRGAFIALGTINDPQKSYHLEFVLHSESRAKRLAAHLEQEIAPPKTVKRGEKTGVYYKRNMVIADLLYYLDGMKSGFAFADVCIEHDIRNNENRATNCTTRNISRSIEVAQKQIDAIELLERTGKLRLLEPELIYTARLRVDNAWATLSELAAAHVPPITKSTLNRRLTKILDKAEKL